MRGGGTAGAGNAAPVEGSRGRWIAGGILLLVPLLFFGSMVLRGYEPTSADTQAALPYSTWGTDYQRTNHQVPDWYPFTFSGMPSYGSFTYMPRSPVHPLAWVQRLAGANRGIWYVFLIALAGWSGFAFLRRQGFSRLASATAALLFSMTPYFLGNIAAGHSTKLEALCLLPLFLLALDLFLDAPDLVRTTFLAAVVAFLAWSNHPQVVFYAGFVGAIYAVSRLLLERRSHAGASYWIRLVPGLAGAAVLALALAAEPYWAVREYAPWSIRGGASIGGAETASGGVGWDYATAWSFHPRELIAFLVPGWFGLEGAAYWGPMPFTQSTHYFGILTLLLAVVGLWRLRSPRRWVWAGISLAVLLAGFGRYFPVLFGPMFRLVPLFDKFRIPSMIYGVLPFCLAYLVAGGLDELLRLLRGPGVVHAAEGAVARKGAAGARREKSPRSGRDPARAFLFVALSAVVLWVVLGLAARGLAGGGNGFLRPEEVARLDAVQRPIVQSERLGILEGSLAQSMLGVILSALVLFWAARRGGRRAVAAGTVLALLAVGDVLLVDRRFYDVGPKPELPSMVPLRGACQFLQGQSGAFRIFPAGREIFSSNAFGLTGLESVGGYHPAKLRAYQDLLGADLISRPAVLKMLNVRYVLSPGRIGWEVPPLYESDGWVYPWPDSLPRAWAVPEVTVVSDFEQVRRLLAGDEFDPARTALVYAADAPAKTGAFAPARVQVVRHAAGSLQLRTESEGDAFVVVSEPAFPPGWKARVDGKDAPIRRVNHILQGIEVPAGRHDVEFTMHSAARVAGARVSRAAAGLMVLLVLAGILAARRRRGSGSESLRAASSQDAAAK